MLLALNEKLGSKFAICFVFWDVWGSVIDSLNNEELIGGCDQCAVAHGKHSTACVLGVAFVLRTLKLINGESYVEYCTLSNKTMNGGIS